MLNRKQKQGVLLITFGTLVLAVAPLAIGRFCFVVDNVSTNDWFVSVIFPVLIILIFLILPFIVRKSFPTLAGFDLTWTQKPRAKIRWYLLLYFTPFLLMVIIGMISKWTGLPAMKFFNYKDTTQLSLTFFILVVLRITILTPVVEEIFWRGFIQTQFAKSFGGTIAVVGQACLFALFHGYPLLGLLTVFMLGLVTGLWRLKRRSLVPIIITHVIINGLWCLGFYPDQYEMSKKNIAVSYVEEINKIGNISLAKDNAHADYKKAIKLHHPPSNVLYDDKIIRKNLWPDELTVEQQQSLQQWLAQNSEALVYFIQGTQKPHYWPHYAGNMIFDENRSRDISELQELACALIWNAKIHANEGDIQLAVDDLVRVSYFGNQFSNGPKPTIVYLIGIGLKSHALETAIQLLGNTELDIRQLASMQEKFQQVNKQTPSTLDLTWEKFSLYDIIQKTFTDDGDGNGHIPRAELKGADMKMLKLMSPGVTEEQIELWYQVDRKTTTGLVNELFDYLAINFPSTPIQLKDENISIDSKTNEIMLENVLYPYVSGINKIHTLFHENRAHQDALITILAILRYENINKTLPENLGILVSDGYLDRLPIDPFSNQPLVYKKGNGGFLLYSVGEDFEDDGGLHAYDWRKTDGDDIFWPVQDTNLQTDEGAIDNTK